MCADFLAQLSLLGSEGLRFLSEPPMEVVKFDVQR